jgi:hypothetical protein
VRSVATERRRQSRVRGRLGGAAEPAELGQVRVGDSGRSQGERASVSPSKCGIRRERGRLRTSTTRATW